MGDGDTVDVLHGLGCFTERQAKVDPVGQAQGHDVGAVFGELQGGGVLWQSSDIHFEEVEHELTVDVMEFILALAVFLFQIGFINLLQVVQVVGALQVDAFMDNKVFPVLDLNQGMLTVGAAEVQGREAVAFLR